MLKAKDVMSKNVITLSTKSKISEAVKIMLENHLNGVPVVDEDQKLVGVICQSDLVTQQKTLSMPSYFTLFDSFIPLNSPTKIEHEFEKMSATTVGQAMTKDPVTININTNINEIADLMVEKKYYTLPVLDDDDKLVGVVGKEDILRVIT